MLALPATEFLRGKLKRVVVVQSESSLVLARGIVDLPNLWLMSWIVSSASYMPGLNLQDKLKVEPYLVMSKACLVSLRLV